MSIGENIRTLRKRNNITQEELGKILNVSDKTVSSWEIDRTEPSIGMVYKMASYFGCKLSDLVGDIDDEEYFINSETRLIAQEIKDNKELYALFHASRNATKEDLEITRDLLLSLKRKERENADD